MTDSQIDVFGPGFVPGKVTEASSAASRAMSRTYAKQAYVDANGDNQFADDINAHEQSSMSSKS